MFTIEADPGHAMIKVRLEGLIDKAGARAMAESAIAEARQHGVERFLIDWREATVGVSVPDIYDYGSEQLDLGLKTTDMVAIVVSRDLAVHDFFETVAHNNGLSLLRCFTNTDQALTWLTNGAETGK